MAKKHEPKPPGQWNTLEELLLVFAVKRHGSKNWDAIAMELHSRVAMQRNHVSSSVITPETCRKEFLRLRRHFVVKTTAAEEEEEEEACLASMLDELRRIRIEELRREVKRHDVSIVLLESKIKRLKEERERILTGEIDLRGRTLEQGETKPSPAINAKGRSSDGLFATDQRLELAAAPEDAGNNVLSELKSVPKREPEGETAMNPVKPLTEPDRDRGSSSRFTRNADNGEDKRDGGEATAEPTRSCRLGESNELRESVSESKRETAASKQSSDVQSSATQSRRKRRRSSSGGTSSDEEVEIEEISPTTTKMVSAVKPPETMVDLLRKIRTHRLGSAFERRLRIQKSERYKTLIRQHMDLRTINSRLDRRAYAQDSRKFYRDLLILFNNAIVFYRKASSEYAAALELRALVLREMKDMLRYRSPERVSSLKSKTSKPVLATCGKRSSIAKPAVLGKARRKENELKKEEMKDVNRGNGSLMVGPKCKKERTLSNSYSNISKEGHKDEKMKKHELGNNELSSHDAPMIKSVNVKKQGAVNFLRRMKQVSSTESDEEEEEKDEGEVSGSEVEAETKKKKRVSKRSTCSPIRKRGKEENMKGNKNTKKAVRAVAMEVAGETTGKRGRESNAEGSGGGGGGGKKRTKR